MHIWKILGMLLLTSATISTQNIQEELAAYTGQLVKAFVKANWIMQKLVKEEMNSAHEYINAAILNRLKTSDPETELDAVKPKIQEEFVSVLDIDQDCIISGGLVWFANRALRTAEKYRELYMRADVMQICFRNISATLNKTCGVTLQRYDRAVDAVEDSLMYALSRLDNIYDDTMGCLRFRYDSLLKHIESKNF